jgi:hypothetical protein
MSVARSVEAGFFPLDKELQVPDGHLLPHAQEAMVRLGSELPFGRVAEHLERILGVVVHASTARRQTLAAGQRVLERQNEQAQPLAACPEEEAAERMAMSSDGAMVPLVGGVWDAREGGGHWRGRTSHTQGRGTDRDDAAHVLCTPGQRRDVC